MSLSGKDWLQLVSKRTVRLSQSRFLLPLSTLLLENRLPVVSAVELKTPLALKARTSVKALRLVELFSDCEP